MAGYTNRWPKVRCRVVGIVNMTETQSAILVSHCNDALVFGCSRSHLSQKFEPEQQAVVWFLRCYGPLLARQLVWQLCVLRVSSSDPTLPQVLASWVRGFPSHQGQDCQWQLDGRPELGGSWSGLAECVAAQYLLECLPCQRFRCRGLVGWEGHCQRL